ncbi:hypothetical protein K503DRAFT_600279 [Rhizopogon vinicolor AM-OR11-026]|uniref:DUF6533 domain-containing protein n=1 Tax=Rhizopogon vinicolor AM-OR11-026 TaxID=1314800 RepID=A0A1B7MIV5_9AGAM|nr:hypothetical protein K503DRAFT_600279 [Rhizopogon vinicolor AM-OR11-026]
MTVVSNDPSLWPIINLLRQTSYANVASLAVVVYDLVLTSGQEFELVWRQRWSFMTFLYLGANYTGIPYIVATMLQELPSVSSSDTVCLVYYYLENCIDVVVNAMLSVIVIIRLYVMYQRSRKMLVFLVIIFLTVQIACVVLGVIQARHTLADEDIFSGMHMCSYYIHSQNPSLIEITWILGTVWEILALCLAVWISAKHSRELQRTSTGWAVADCLTILIKSHVFYFASFVCVSCLQLSYFSPTLDSTSVGSEIYSGLLQFVTVVQSFVLGPRLILGVREYHAKLVADSDDGIGMTSIVFQERIYITTGGGV